MYSIETGVSAKVGSVSATHETVVLAREVEKENKSIIIQH